MKISENIRTLRRREGLTLKDVANRIGVSEATVQRYESGAIGAIPYDTIVQLAEIFGVKPWELLGWDKNFELVASCERITNDDVRLIRAYHKATPARREAVRALLDLE